MSNHSHEKAATNGLKQPAATKAFNRGGAGEGPATTRGVDPQPYVNMCMHVYIRTICTCLHMHMYMYTHVHSLTVDICMHMYIHMY